MTASVDLPTLNRMAAAGALWIIDLDGVIWLSGTPIGNISGAMEELEQAGVSVIFVTNNSAPTSEELLKRLDRAGVNASSSVVVSSAQAAASLLDPGESVCMVGERGLAEALEDRSVEVRSSEGDAAVVGWSRSFDYDQLAAVATCARRSGRLIGTNEDPTHPTPDGLLPGAGSLLAAVATASGVVPQVAGKPHAPMVELLRRRCQLGSDGPPAWVVGDQPGTDGRLAQALGLPFALVDSGVTPPGSVVDAVPVAVRCADFVQLVAAALRRD